MINDKVKYINYKEIKPQGWLLDKLETQKNGLSGHIDEIWEDLNSNNAWLGGKGEDWERGPYYLDGLIPLSIELNDSFLIKKSYNWIINILKSQEENGFFGPKSNNDWWPRMVALKALIIYADAFPESKESKQIQVLIEKFLHYFDDNLEQFPLKMWGFARGMELFISIKWIYNKTNNPFYDNLAIKVMDLSLNWNQLFFKDFPFDKKISEFMPWEDYINFMDKYDEKLIKENQKILEKYQFYFMTYHLTHGVNIAMAVKYLGYYYQITDEKKYLNNLIKGLSQLYLYHGQANGMFSCDEHLDGVSPSQGTELCTVVELMFSLEELIKITDDSKWFEFLDIITFNALEATISQDGCSHQYDQQVNQISCTIDRRNWYNNKDDSNIFGLEPHFGCCTANMHQGWPKYCSSLWGKNDEGYTCYSYSPLIIQDNDIKIEVLSEYPYKPNLKLKINTNNSYSFKLRINTFSFCDNYEIFIDNELIEHKVEENYIIIDKTWSHNLIEIKFDFKVWSKEYYHGISYYYGPLLLSLPIKSRDKIIKDRLQFSDHEYRPMEKFNFGFKLDEKYDIKEENGMPYLIIKGYEILNWKVTNNSAGEFPQNLNIGSSKILKLIPYGKTILRVANFPIIK
ncbi:MAG: glycoside hydrolase family 127 protein [Spirochaetales bacterium]|nr:glycoside hydrolase family 127 protein [Spirochaetales bacterium]